MRLLWIPHAGWHIPQRAHLFCQALADRHEVHVTDWAADFASPLDYLSRRYLRNFRYRQFAEGPITVHGVPRLSPAVFSSRMRGFNTAIFSQFVQRIIEERRIDAVVGTFVVPPPGTRRVAPRLVFDLFDDNAAYWRTFGRGPRIAEEIEQTERAYLQSADAVVAASSVLAERARCAGAYGPVHLIPNGVDLSRFANQEVKGLRAQWKAKGPVIGMVGNHDKAVELDKVLEAARHFRTSNLTFLVAGRGKALPLAQKRARRERLGNVRFAGGVPLECAPATVSAFDVGLCPYAKTPGAEAGSPMRLLMYSAAGLPVVCTDLEEVRRMGFPNVVLVEDRPDALAEGIGLALRLPRARPPQVEAYDLSRLAAQYEAVLKG